MLLRKRLLHSDSTNDSLQVIVMFFAISREPGQGQLSLCLSLYMRKIDKPLYMKLPYCLM